MLFPIAFAEDQQPTPSDLGDAGTDLFDYFPFLYDLMTFFPYILGPLAVFMVIYSGFTFITSFGKEDKVKKAKHTLLHSLLGTIALILFILFLLHYFPIREKIDLPPLIPQ